MVDENTIISGAIVASGGYVGTKLFGSVLATMGDDINKLYVKGRDLIVEAATKKIENPEDGKKVNIRAARDVLWNGAITEDEVCAEYFGGMLAASRSEDGKDDGVVHYIDTIKAMSARQLELHYVIYKSWQTLLNETGKSINVAQSLEINTCKIFFAGSELKKRHLPFDRDLTVLYRLGLLSEYKYDYHVVGEHAFSYVQISPTTFGVLLFAIAHNKIETWKNFQFENYESTAGILPVHFISDNLEKMCNVMGMPFNTDA